MNAKPCSSGPVLGSVRRRRLRDRLRVHSCSAHRRGQSPSQARHAVTRVNSLQTIRRLDVREQPSRHCSRRALNDSRSSMQHRRSAEVARGHGQGAGEDGVKCQSRGQHTDRSGSAPSFRCR